MTPFPDYPTLLPLTPWSLSFAWKLSHPLCALNPEEYSQPLLGRGIQTIVANSSIPTGYHSFQIPAKFAQKILRVRFPLPTESSRINSLYILPRRSILPRTLPRGRLRLRGFLPVMATLFPHAGLLRIEPRLCCSINCPRRRFHHVILHNKRPP